MADSTLDLGGDAARLMLGCFTGHRLARRCLMNASEPLNPLFRDHGWLGEDGITLEVQRDNTQHYAFGSDLVKTTLDAYSASGSS